MESHLASRESSISSQFVHKLPNTADWATDRRMVKYFNSGGNSFSPVGVKNMRFDLTSSGQEFLDPLTTMVQIKVVNDGYVQGNADTNIHMVNFAPCFIKRCIVRAGGVTVSDEDFWSRNYHMLMQFSPQSARDNLSVAAGQRGTVITNQMTLGFPLLAPLFQQTKALPLNVMSLQVHLELVDATADVMLKTSDLPVGVNAQSSSWHIEEPVLLCDLITLDSSLSAEFSNHLLKGKSLSIPFVSYYTVPHVITNGAGGFQIAMTRSLTRLKAMFMTFAHSSNDKYAYDLKASSISDSQITEWQAQIGSKKYPETALQTYPEYWFKLLEAIGIHSSMFTNSAITLSDYKDDSWIIGVNLQKVLSEDPAGNYSGTSTKMGDLLTFRTKNIATSLDTAYVTLVYDGILSLSEESVSVFD